MKDPNPIHQQSVFQFGGRPLTFSYASKHDNEYTAIAKEYAEHPSDRAGYFFDFIGTNSDCPIFRHVITKPKFYTKVMKQSKKPKAPLLPSPALAKFAPSSAWTTKATIPSPSAQSFTSRSATTTA